MGKFRGVASGKGALYFFRSRMNWKPCRGIQTYYVRRLVEAQAGHSPEFGVTLAEKGTWGRWLFLSVWGI